MQSKRGANSRARSAPESGAACPAKGRRAAQNPSSAPTERAEILIRRAGETRHPGQREMRAIRPLGCISVRQPNWIQIQFVPPSGARQTVERIRVLMHAIFCIRRIDRLARSAAIGRTTSRSMTSLAQKAMQLTRSRTTRGRRRRVAPAGPEGGSAYRATRRLRRQARRGKATSEGIARLTGPSADDDRRLQRVGRFLRREPPRAARGAPRCRAAR